MWIVHGSYTGGHASAARALQEALRVRGVDAQVYNLADHMNSPIPVRTAAEKALKGGRVVQALRSWWFEKSFRGSHRIYALTNAALAVAAHFAGPFLEKLRREQPDLVISTHSATTSILSRWRAQGRFQAPLHAVVTDFAAHCMWSQERVERYYVAGDAARRDLERFGVDPARIRITGIPVRPAFSRPPRDRGRVKRALGLDPDRPVLLLMGGSLGYADFAGQLRALDALPQEFQVVVITGRNREKRRELQALSFRHPVRVEGFVDDMPDWIEAADLVISRPGGLTTSEVLARGRPLLVPQPGGPLGAHNTERLKVTGAVRAVDGAEGLAREVARLLDHPDQLRAMEEAARRAGRPDSASAVAADVLRSFRTPSAPGGSSR